MTPMFPPAPPASARQSLGRALLAAPASPVSQSRSQTNRADMPGADVPLAVLPGSPGPLAQPSEGGDEYNDS